MGHYFMPQGKSPHSTKNGSKEQNIPLKSILQDDTLDSPKIAPPQKTKQART